MTSLFSARPPKTHPRSDTEAKEKQAYSQAFKVPVWHERVYLFRPCGWQWQGESRPTESSCSREFSTTTDKETHQIVSWIDGILPQVHQRIATPLSDLTKKSLPDKIQWNDNCEQAFVTLKRVLCQSPILVNPDFDKPFLLQTDASDRGIGAVLSQEDDEGGDQPVAYFSRKLLPREVRYSTIEKECLAIKLGVEAFKVYLLGRQFTI